MVIPLPPAATGFYNDGWVQMDESHLLRPTTSFSQRDLNEGRVWYITDDGKGPREKFSPVPSQLGQPYNILPNSTKPKSRGQSSEQKRYSDVIVFSVADSSIPPNVLKDQKFLIEVEEPSIVIQGEPKLQRTLNQIELQVHIFFVSVP